MLIDTLNECIIDMKTVREMETASADTKKQAQADYEFKQLIQNLRQIVYEINLAVENSDFRPSVDIISSLKSFMMSCEKIVTLGVANEATTRYISAECKKMYQNLGEEWIQYYYTLTTNILNLLNTIKSIAKDENKIKYAENKIKKASNWNNNVENYNYLRQGLIEANDAMKDLGLNEESAVFAFLKLVSEEKATVIDLNEEILEWIKAEGIGEKIYLHFR